LSGGGEAGRWLRQRSLLAAIRSHRLVLNKERLFHRPAENTRAWAAIDVSRQTPVSPITCVALRGRLSGATEARVFAGDPGNATQFLRALVFRFSGLARIRLVNTSYGENKRSLSERSW